MANAPNHPDDLLAHVASKAYQEYQETPTLVGFLKALAIVGSREDRGIVQTWWEECPPSSDSPRTELLNWLARLRRWQSSSQGTSSLSPDVDQRMKAAVEALETRDDRIAQIAEYRRLESSTDYGHFRAADVFDRALIQGFGPKNPALVVAKYLDAFFPARNDSGHTAAASNESAAEIVVSRQIAEFLHQVVLPWALHQSRGRGEETQWPLGQATFLQQFLVPWLLDDLDNWTAAPTPRPFGHRDVATLLPLLPQALFERILRHDDSAWLEGPARAWRHADCESWGWEIVEVALSLPIGRTVTVAELSLSPGNLLREFVEENGLEAHMLPMLPVRSLSSILWKLADDGGGFVTLGNSFKVEVVNVLARPIWQGVSPWSAHEAANLGYWFGVICELPPPHWKLRITLDEFYCSPPEHESAYSGPIGIEPPSGEAQRRRRMNHGIALVDELRSDGWSEFANAFLAFLLATQIAVHPDRLECDLSRLDSCLGRLRREPGHEYVKKAMALVLSSSGSQTPRNPYYLQWEGHYADVGPSVAGVKLRDSVVANGEILDDVLKNLGSEYYMRLPGMAKRQLVNAEELWILMSRNAGTGRGDFGALMVSYAKVVEITLREKLRPVLTSTAYVDYRRPKGKEFDAEFEAAHITLNQLLKLCKDFSGLPSNLKSEFLRAGIRLHEDQKLISSFRNIGFDRNTGAHTTKLQARQVMSVREVYYEDAGLAKLLDLLP